MSDTALRLDERAAAVGDPTAEAVFVARHLRCGGRDPRRDPRTGDIVEVSLWGWTRQDANGDGSDGWARSRRRVVKVTKTGKGLNTPHLEWVLEPMPKHPFGPSRGVIQVRSWRLWAQGGRVVAIGAGR